MIKMTAPWGTEEINSNLGMISYCKRLTQHSIENSLTRDVELAARDVEAYNAILDSNSESVASTFFKEKELMKRRGNRYKGGMAVVLRMKAKDMMP